MDAKQIPPWMRNRKQPSEKIDPKSEARKKIANSRLAQLKSTKSPSK